MSENKTYQQRANEDEAKREAARQKALDDARKREEAALKPAAPQTAKTPPPVVGKPVGAMHTPQEPESPKT